MKCVRFGVWIPEHAQFGFPFDPRKHLCDVYLIE